MSKQAIKENNKTEVSSKDSVRTQIIEMDDYQTKQLDDAVSNRQLAQQQLVMVNNTEHTVKGLILNGHGIDPKDVLDFTYIGNVATVKLPEQDGTKTD